MSVSSLKKYAHFVCVRGCECVGWMSGYIVGNMDDSCMQSHATHHTANPKSKDEYTHYTPILEAPERNP